MGKLSLVEQALLLHKEYYGEGDFGTVVKDYDYYPKVAEKFTPIWILNLLPQLLFIREVVQ